MSLADYLAKNYLTADSEKKSKKRKRKNKDGLKIDDDDNLGWNTKADEDDEDAPMVGESCNSCATWHSANILFSVGGGTLKKNKKKSKSDGAAMWTAVGVAAPSHAQQVAADEAAANAIIASTAADREKAAESTLR